MKVTLLSCTPMALELLLRTKNTRLKFDSPPEEWSPQQKADHLAYMRDTIKSSWEFVDYTFEITGVSRAFTHQLVRTRTGVYAQESQRTVDASNNGYLKPTPKGTAYDAYQAYTESCDNAFDAYAYLMRTGWPAQDARGVLPTATLTSIIAKFNLRTLHDMAKTRLCTRTQGEYQNVFRAMRAEVIKVHPWVEEHRFMEVHCVAEGTCAFPRFGKTECKFYDTGMDQTLVKEMTHARFWEEEQQVAVPVANNGKTM